MKPCYVCGAGADDVCQAVDGEASECPRPIATIVQPKLPRVKFFAGASGTPYMPCNGTEGEYFHAMWCEECERDKVMSGQATTEDADKDPDLYCEILNRSFRDEPLPEWVYGEDGQPKCTAFVPVGTPIVERDDRTLDMFASEALKPD
jgi:hypothetical protein